MRKSLCKWLALFIVLLILPVSLAAADSDGEKGYDIYMEKNAKIYIKAPAFNAEATTLNGIRYIPSYAYKGHLQIKYSELVLAVSLNDCEDKLNEIGVELEDVTIRDGLAVLTRSQDAPAPNDADVKSAATQLYHAINYFYNNASISKYGVALGFDDDAHAMHAVYEGFKSWPAKALELSRSKDITLDALRSLAGEVYEGLNSLHDWLTQQSSTLTGQQRTVAESLLTFWSHNPSFTNLTMYKSWADGTIANANAVKEADAEYHRTEVQMRRILYKNKVALKDKHFILTDDADTTIKFYIARVFIPATPTPFPVIIP